MNNWITLISFTYPHEAYLVKGRLESLGIEVLIKDELTAQVNNFYSNAIGGVKLLVNENDYDKAYQILVESGNIKKQSPTTNKFLVKFDKISSKLPLVGKSIIELRLIGLITVILSIIIVPIVLLSLPSDIEKLTAKSWCIDKIYYKGKELIPQSLGIRLEGYFSGCSESMSFREDGFVDFPGIDSYGYRAKWEYKNDSLIISEWETNKKFSIDNNLQITDEIDTTQKSIYLGVYRFDIENDMITMKSDSLKIIGKALELNF